MAADCLQFLLKDLRKQLSCGSSGRRKSNEMGDKLDANPEQDQTNLGANLEHKQTECDAASSRELNSQSESKSNHSSVKIEQEQDRKLEQAERRFDAQQEPSGEQISGQFRARLRQQLNEKRAQAIRFDQLAACSASARLLYVNMTPTGANMLPSATCLMFAISLFLVPHSSLWPQVARVSAEQAHAPLSPPLNSPANLLSPTAADDAARRPNLLAPLGPLVDWPQLGTRLLRQIATASAFGSSRAQNRDRWVNLNVNKQNSRNQFRPSHGGGTRQSTSNRNPTTPSSWLSLGALASLSNNQYTRFNRAWDQLRNRLGGRNTVRVHNAFRDLAWRLLSRLAMPAPAIYELRRQHFYPVEEDVINDALFNRNTTKTIRSKRFLRLDGASEIPLSEEPSGEPAAKNKDEDRSSKRADDDDEDDSLRERFRMRLEDLANLSRRSLFGRVIRLPSIFPFKRLQSDDEKPSQNPNLLQKEMSKKRPRFSILRRRRKESDKQLITINDKQYYVDDDGELKELKEGSTSP